MSTFSTPSSHAPCPDCGIVLSEADWDEHLCDPELVLDHRMLELKDEVVSFDAQFQDYLESSHGRLAQWHAAYRRTKT